MKIEKNSAGHIVSGTAVRDEKRRIYDYYIGIDPDVKESGYAVWCKKERKMYECTNYGFFYLYDKLSILSTSEAFKEDTFIIHIEGGWLVEKSNFHTNEKKGYHTIKESRAAQKISKNVGSNHQIGKIIIEMCIHLNLSFVVRPPIKPRFANEKLFKKVTGWTGRTNADARSAANYVYGY